MPGISRFEDVKGWQEARRLVSMIYRLTSDGAFSKDYGMRDQIRRAAVSTMSNVAEGFDCESQAEFARFLGIARRSAAEVQSLLYASLDVGYIGDEQFQLHHEQARKTRAFIGGLKRSLKRHA